MTTAIIDITLWDTLGNSCRVELYRLSPDTWEVYFHDFNSDIPSRLVSSLLQCNHAIDIWLAAKRKAGFSEPQPTHNPEAWRV